MLESQCSQMQFLLKYIPCLGYIITCYWVKPDPNKVQGNMYLVQPTTTDESQALIGMFHYHKDMWKR